MRTYLLTAFCPTAAAGDSGEPHRAASGEGGPAPGRVSGKSSAVLEEYYEGAMLALLFVQKPGWLRSSEVLFADSWLLSVNTSWDRAGRWEHVKDGEVSERSRFP